MFFIFVVFVNEEAVLPSIQHNINISLSLMVNVRTGRLVFVIKVNKTSLTARYIGPYVKENYRL